MANCIKMATKNLLLRCHIEIGWAVQWYSGSEFASRSNDLWL